MTDEPRRRFWSPFRLIAGGIILFLAAALVNVLLNATTDIKVYEGAPEFIFGAVSVVAILLVVVGVNAKAVEIGVRSGRSD